MSLVGSCLRLNTFLPFYLKRLSVRTQTRSQQQHNHQIKHTFIYWNKPREQAEQEKLQVPGHAQGSAKSGAA